MSGDDQIRRVVRHEVQRLKQGDPQPCAVCGESSPALLRRASRALVEFHHLAGVANDPELGVFLCLTHHSWCTEAMRDAGVQLAHAEERSLLERLQAVLQGLRIFFDLASRLLASWDSQLGALIAALDRDCPDWRQLEEAS